VSKALSTGWSGIFRWKDVEVTNAPSGQPLVTLHGDLRELLAGSRLMLSLSHSDSHVVALPSSRGPDREGNAVLETSSGFSGWSLPLLTAADAYILYQLIGVSVITRATVIGDVRSMDLTKQLRSTLYDEERDAQKFMATRDTTYLSTVSRAAPGDPRRI